MLRKLLKHEFRATARVMIPLYLITVLLDRSAGGAHPRHRIVGRDGDL